MKIIQILTAVLCSASTFGQHSNEFKRHSLLITRDHKLRQSAQALNKEAKKRNHQVHIFKVHEHGFGYTWKPLLGDGVSGILSNKTIFLGSIATFPKEETFTEAPLTLGKLKKNESYHIYFGPMTKDQLTKTLTLSKIYQPNDITFLNRKQIIDHVDFQLQEVTAVISDLNSHHQKDSSRTSQLAVRNNLDSLQRKKTDLKWVKEYALARIEKNKK